MTKPFDTLQNPATLTPMSKPLTIEDFRRWGSEGGRKSRRTLTPDQARVMVEAKRAKKKACEPTVEAA